MEYAIVDSKGNRIYRLIRTNSGKLMWIPTISEPSPRSIFVPDFLLIEELSKEGDIQRIYNYEM